MKKIKITLVLIVVSLVAVAQNTFPTPSGDVGIGTLSPDDALEIVGGITINGVSRGTSNSAWGSLSSKPVYTLFSSRSDGIDNSLHGFGSIKTTHFESPYIYGYNSSGNMIVFGSVTAGDRNPATGLTPRMVIDLYNGNTGIGETTPDFPLQIRTPNETLDPISFGLDITRVNNGTRGLSFGMATDHSYSVIGAHNADLRLGHTFNTGSGGQPIFHPDLTIKHTDQNLGNVGIGTTNPSQRLEVNGNIALDNFQILSEGGSSIGFGSGGIGNEDDDITIDIANDGELELHRNGTNVFSIGNQILIDRTNSRNVGIGIENPQSKLAVNGQIRATEVKVLSDISVPDYVFESDYQLRTLKETKEYITKHKHLPEIPSAAEIGENGIDLGDMNMRLLKKIEELTLYQIELMEKLEKQSSRLLEVEKELQSIKN